MSDHRNLLKNKCSQRPESEEKKTLSTNSKFTNVIMDSDAAHCILSRHTKTPHRNFLTIKMSIRLDTKQTHTHKMPFCTAEKRAVHAQKRHWLGAMRLYVQRPCIYARHQTVRINDRHHQLLNGNRHCLHSTHTIIETDRHSLMYGAARRINYDVDKNSRKMSFLLLFLRRVYRIHIHCCWVAYDGGGKKVGIIFVRAMEES